MIFLTWMSPLIYQPQKNAYEYHGYFVVFGIHDTDRVYVKNSAGKFLGVSSGFSCEEEAKEYIDFELNK